MIVIAATQNKHKIEEIESITKQFGIEIISRKDAGIPDFEIEEDGDTFEYNSEKKAREIMQYSGKTTIADDSGLVVDALSGAPGVYSARFAGVAGDNADEENNKKLLMLMKDLKKDERGAKFVSVITMIYPNGDKIIARGECEGYIINEPRGKGGFGYDPLFVPVGYDKTYAELTSEEKNKISHRSRALSVLKEKLENKI
ncbi:XTP/dITP diphosphatase [Anaerovorax odorimutans]|uniref:XTP/dITP diphosphatase n=1 Tax=Anaerovorax odorimutans TaxID=109327 RepID=UPI0004028276|nr:XTP/dITP diphosphatase [Anaerovorax odorimutans]